MFTKRIKKSERGITFSFLNEGKTMFEVGMHYKYILDAKNKKLVILPAQEGNTVSKKKLSDRVKSLFDIRKKEAVELFNNADYLQVTVQGDQILVEGFNADNESKLGQINKGGVVRDITELIRVKKVASRTFSANELKLAAGQSHGQLSIDDILGYVHIAEESAVASRKPVDLQHFKNLRFPLQIVSTFSGAGLLDYGFIKEGFEVVFAIDYSADACKTYRKNIGNHIVNADVTKYDKTKVPAARILIGGPSCKPFSRERQDYFSVKREIADHPDSQLVAEYIRWAQAGSYDIFVMENVPELLKASDGAYLRMIKEELSDFEISYGIVNDAEQGGYQNRSRAILIGSKIGKIEIPGKKLDQSQWKTVGDALAAVDDSWPNQNDRTNSSPAVIERMRYVPQGGNWRSIPPYLQTKARHSNSYHRLNNGNIAPTLVNFRKPVIIHPTEDRILSVSEAAALCGLSKEFCLEGSLDSKQQQLGNSVPVKIGQSIAGVIKAAIERYQTTIMRPVFC